MIVAVLTGLIFIALGVSFCEVDAREPTDMSPIVNTIGGLVILLGYGMIIGVAT